MTAFFFRYPPPLLLPKNWFPEGSRYTAIASWISSVTVASLTPRYFSFFFFHLTVSFPVRFTLCSPLLVPYHAPRKRGERFRTRKKRWARGKDERSLHLVLSPPGYLPCLAVNWIMLFCLIPGRPPAYSRSNGPDTEPTSGFAQPLPYIILATNLFTLNYCLG